MILAHVDSNGERWYFRIDAPRNTVAVVARKLSRAASRVRNAHTGPRTLQHTNTELARAMLAEAVALADLQAYNGATVDDFRNAPNEERFLLQ